MGRRSRIVGFGSTALLVLTGAVSAAAVGGPTGEVLALVLIGGGLLAAVSLVFLEVGLSEDRARARERARRELKPTHVESPGLPRARGRRRRPG